ncbi:MAG: prolyl-tRNA synthetase [Parcubacteria group bacterium]|nr:prolyl-tRNA synthetase [Parcubacteria group bacterium]
MKQSSLFIKTRKQAPADEVSKNARLLIRAGFIHKEAAGVYSYLPLGLRVLERINTIIREEMAGLGAEEAAFTTLQNPETWKKSGRWELPVWFKTALNDGGELGLGWTHEEAVTALMKNHVSSYKDLPRKIFQIHTKFRNEERAKSGLLRGREFLMKDLYSFHTTEEDLDAFYEKAKEAYRQIFERVGIGGETHVTLSSGGDFSPYSHEFQTLSPAGEDTIYLSREKNIAINQEIYTEKTRASLGLSSDELTEETAIEVGNIFKLGTRFSAPLGLMYKDAKGESQPVIMGSYGIGPGRIMGTIAELFSDERGLVWPEAVAPFSVHLLRIGNTDAVIETADALYRHIAEKGERVLFDDREDASAGEKFADSDLFGIPLRLVVSEKSLSAGGIEVKKRNENESRVIPESELPAFVKGESA